MSDLNEFKQYLQSKGYSPERAYAETLMGKTVCFCFVAKEGTKKPELKDFTNITFIENIGDVAYLLKGGFNNERILKS